MTMARDLTLIFWAELAAAMTTIFVIVYALWPVTPAQASMRDDMAAIEKLLIGHGYAVEGFATTPAPDLSLADELAPDGCRLVIRARLLARLAIVRRQPDHALYADDVARGAAAVVAQKAGRMTCLAVEPW